MQIHFLSKKSKVGHFRSLICVRISTDGCIFPIAEKLKPQFYIKNHITNTFEGPFSVIFSDLRDPRLFSLDFPQILCSSWTNDDQKMFINPKYLGSFFDYDWIISMKNPSSSFLKILEFQIVFDFDEVSNFVSGIH